MAQAEEVEASLMPEYFEDTAQNTVYVRTRYLGRGAFAACHEVINLTTCTVQASKTISKARLEMDKKSGKIEEEIVLHKSLDHVNIVKFLSVFSDLKNIYIITELCSNYTLLELQKRRTAITEYECRYYLDQIISGVDYLHDNRIIHRDLKLANIFLDGKMQIKIGDFGLAIRLPHRGARILVGCGTPNYIAPEMIKRELHSYEVDMWSIGCIMYALLVGAPPFQSNYIRNIYAKIINGCYVMPMDLSEEAKELIRTLLKVNPVERPTAKTIRTFSFMTDPHLPKSLTKTCLLMAPREDYRGYNQGGFYNYEDTNNEDLHMLKLHMMNTAMPKMRIVLALEQEGNDLVTRPLVWVSQCIHSRENYKFAYQLTDGTIGVVLNDLTKLLLLPNYINIHYINQTGGEVYMTVNEYSEEYDEVIQLLMDAKSDILHSVESTAADATIDAMSRPPRISTWRRYPESIVMHLNNGTVQANFTDGTKLIFCSRMRNVTYIDNNGTINTYRFSTLKRLGCPANLHPKFMYAYKKINQMLQR